MQLMVLLMYVDSQYRFCSFSRKLRKPFNTAANFWPLALVLSESGGVNVRYLVPNKGWKWWEKWTIISLKLTRVLERVTWVMYNPHFLDQSHMCMSYDYTLRMLHHVFNLDILKKYMKNNFVMFCAFPRKHIYIYIHVSLVQDPASFLSAPPNPRRVRFGTNLNEPPRRRHVWRKKPSTCSPAKPWPFWGG